MCFFQCDDLGIKQGCNALTHLLLLGEGGADSAEGMLFPSSADRIKYQRHLPGRLTGGITAPELDGRVHYLGSLKPYNKGSIALYSLDRMKW